METVKKSKESIPTQGTSSKFVVSLSRHACRRESSTPAACFELNNDEESEKNFALHSSNSYSLGSQSFDRHNDNTRDQKQINRIVNLDQINDIRPTPNNFANKFVEGNIDGTQINQMTEKTQEREIFHLKKRIYQSVRNHEPIDYHQDDMFYDEFDSTNDDKIDDLTSSNLFADPKFERQERLDVKKPGPLFNVNNFAFKREGSSENDMNYLPASSKNMFKDIVAYKKEHNSLPLIQSASRSSSEYQKVDYYSDDSKEYEDRAIQSNQPPTNSDNDYRLPTEHTPESDKRFSTEDKFSSNSLGRDIVETNYVFITIRGVFQNWKQGAGLVGVLSELLRVPSGSFNDIGVQGNQLTFQVSPTMEGLNPSLVAAKADEMRQTIQQKTGLELIATGIGDQSGVSSILYWGQENQQLLLAIGLCLLVTATLVTAMVIFLLRKRQVSRQKLKDLTQSIDTETTRDYQDLCRTRMAIKSSTSETIKDSTKMAHAHLSRDSESSRSSTSSWCEEPVLTNMDISTGHMVLSYMEDHLRNKFRLEQEWLALCSYEAEPSTSILTASKPENMMKNRYDDALPYDHSRVILNALANVNGLDYINASLITDHDPRHPAYIAAQSPVAESVADFWQMIWEQGCAVLVLLTRTNENGKNLCFKYWPEEGSQLYHIYEVHLVSEHIWCEDYLVRSFYLKNVRTSETRTVTQFHFQSWPENGIPTSTKALLEFRRKVNKSYRGRSCPIVVHCSDGAGRTGTYCLIDMVLHRMSKGSREIDIAATLEHLRDQRAHAVRNKQQFEFVLTAVAEEVHAILRALPQ